MSVCLTVTTLMWQFQQLVFVNYYFTCMTTNATNRDNRGERLGATNAVTICNAKGFVNLT